MWSSDISHRLFSFVVDLQIMKRTFLNRHLLRSWQVVAKCDIQIVCQYLVDQLHDAPGQCLLASDVESQLCIDVPICDRNRASFAEQHRWHWFQDLLRCKIKNYFLVNRPPGMMVVIENEFVKFIDHNRGRGAKRNWSEMA